MPKTDKRAAQHTACIVEETLRIIDERVSARQEYGRYQARLQTTRKDNLGGTEEG